MTTITFLSPRLHKPVVLDVAPEAGRTLLSVMDEYKLRESCCGKGQCGSCAVKVVPRRADHAPHPVALSGPEKRTLLKGRKLSWAEFDAKYLDDMPPLWRLACQFVIPDEPILVAF